MSVRGYKPDYSRDKHGEAAVGRETKLYKCWLQIRETLSSKDPLLVRLYSGLPEYEPWRDYRVFREWAYQNGYDETKGLVLGRKDKTLGFSPDNCRWQRYPKMISVVCRETGEQFETIKDASVKYGCKHNGILRALRTGWRCAGLHWRYAD